MKLMSADWNNLLPSNSRTTRLTAQARTSEYRSRARRLRHRFRNQPAQLHQSLAALCNQENARQSQATPPTTGEVDSSVQYIQSHAFADPSDSFTGRPAPGAASRFAAQVESMLDGPVLRYSARQSLLTRAEKLGLGRFEANLIIATIQHQQHPHLAAVPEKTAGGSLLRGIAIALALEATAVAGIWMALRLF